MSEPEAIPMPIPDNRVYGAVRLAPSRLDELPSLTDQCEAFRSSNLADAMATFAHEDRYKGVFPIGTATPLTTNGRYEGRQINMGYGGGGPGQLLTAFRDDYYGVRGDDGARDPRVATMLASVFYGTMSFDVELPGAATHSPTIPGFQNFGTHQISYQDGGLSRRLVLQVVDVRRAATERCRTPASRERAVSEFAYMSRDLGFQRDVKPDLFDHLETALREVTDLSPQESAALIADVREKVAYLSSAFPTAEERAARAASRAALTPAPGGDSQLDGRETATVLAALRFYQSQGLADDPALRSGEIHDLATAGDTIMSSLCGDEIDLLCARLKASSSKVPASTDMASEPAPLPEAQGDKTQHLKR